MVVKWITYKGKDILLNDYSNLDEKGFLKAMDDVDKVPIKGPEKSILCLTNITNTHATKTLTDKAKELMKERKKYMKAVAIVGVSGVKRIIAKMVVKDVYFAKDEIDAKEWLIKQ